MKNFIGSLLETNDPHSNMYHTTNASHERPVPDGHYSFGISGEHDPPTFPETIFSNNGEELMVQIQKAQKEWASDEEAFYAAKVSEIEIKATMTTLTSTRSELKEKLKQNKDEIEISSAAATEAESKVTTMDQKRKKSKALLESLQSQLVGKLAALPPPHPGAGLVARLKLPVPQQDDSFLTPSPARRVSSMKDEANLRLPRRLSSASEALFVPRKKIRTKQRVTLNRKTVLNCMKDAQAGNDKAKAMLTDIMTNTPLPELREILELQKMCKVHSLDSSMDNDIMRCIVFGQFHLRPDFAARISNDLERKRAWISVQKGQLTKGKNSPDRKDRIIFCLQVPK